jgi:hypothetical protein
MEAMEQTFEEGSVDVISPRSKIFLNYSIMPLASSTDEQLFSGRVWFNPKNKAKHSDLLKFLVQNFSLKGTVGVARAFITKQDKLNVKQVFNLSLYRCTSRTVQLHHRPMHTFFL